VLLQTRNVCECFHTRICVKFARVDAMRPHPPCLGGRDYKPSGSDLLSVACPRPDGDRHRFRRLVLSGRPHRSLRRNQAVAGARASRLSKVSDSRKDVQVGVAIVVFNHAGDERYAFDSGPWTALPPAGLIRFSSARSCWCFAFWRTLTRGGTVTRPLHICHRCAKVRDQRFFSRSVLLRDLRAVDVPRISARHRSWPRAFYQCPDHQTDSTRAMLSASILKTPSLPLHANPSGLSSSL
jgi:hypothetical protein